jgi:hypothetical protein
LYAGGGGATQPYGAPLTRMPVGQSAALPLDRPLEQSIGGGGSEHGLIERRLQFWDKCYTYAWNSDSVHNREDGG